MVTTNGFASNRDKSLHIYFFCVKRQAKNDFLKDVEKPFFLLWLQGAIFVGWTIREKNCHSSGMLIMVNLIT